MAIFVLTLHVRKTGIVHRDNRRRSSAPISASLFRYYSASPNASVIRIDLLDLTIADTGITLDLDKDWHPDLYENRNAGATWFIFF